MINFILIGLGVFFISTVLVISIRKLAIKYHLVAKVTPDRWHKKPTALFGGLGIFVTFFSVGLWVLLTNEDSNISLLPYFMLLAGSLGICIFGLLDDIYHFRYFIKIVTQIAFASFIIFSGGCFKITPFHIIDILITYFWFIGIINAINLLDNMDGLASGIVFISSIFLLFFMFISGESFHSIQVLLLWVFIMSILGFWVHNFHPASIFMGDTGSLFLGYFLAAFLIPDFISKYNVNATESLLKNLLVPSLIIAVPIFDTSLVTVVRKLNNRPISLGGKDHSSHRFVKLGLSEVWSVLVLYVLAIISGLLALLVIKVHGIYLYIFFSFFILMFLLGRYLSRADIYNREFNVKGLKKNI